MSWDFIYKQLSVGEESNPTKGNNNRKHISVIFGANASQLLKGLMNMSFKQNGRDNIKVNCYTYCKRMLGFKIIGALRDIKILNDKDISYVIENCINEARILNTSQIGNDSEIKHINLITMSNKNENVANYIFIDIEDNLNENNNDNTPYLSKNDIELYLNCLNNMRITYKKNIYVSIIGCIEINDSNYSNNNNNFDNSDVYINNLNTNVLENIKTLSQDKNNNFKYPITNLYVKPNNENTKEIEIKPIDVSPLSVSVSQLKLSQSKENKNNNEHQSQKEASIEINYNRRKVNTVSNENDSPELIECKNEIILLKKEKEQLEQLVKLLETSLKYERNEKVSLVNENEMLKQKLKEVTKNQYKK